MPNYYTVYEVDQNSALHVSIKMHDDETSKILIKNESKYPNGGTLNHQDKEGKTPLHLAIETSNDTIAKMLIMPHLNFDLKDKKGNTVLHLAIKSKKNELAKLIIEAGASMNIEDNEGRTQFEIGLQALESETKKLWREKSKEIKDYFSG